MANGIFDVETMIALERQKRAQNAQNSVPVSAEGLLQGINFGGQSPMGSGAAPQPVMTPKPAFVPPAEKLGMMDRIRSGLKDPATMAGLAAAFNQMTLNPNAQLQTRASDLMALRTVRNQANQTVETLRSSNDPQAAQVADMIEADPVNAKAYTQAYITSQLRAPTETYTQMTGAQINAKSGVTAYEPETVYNVGVNSGKVTEIGGGGLTLNMPDLTESQGGATNFYNRAKNAEVQLKPYESEGTQMGQAVLGMVPWGNVFQTAEYQVFSQIQANFISAVLRKESGAVISPSEFANEAKKYFPQPGDKPLVIEEKRRARQDAIDGLRVQAGEGAALVDKVPPNVTVKKVN